LTHFRGSILRERRSEGKAREGLFEQTPTSAFGGKAEVSNLRKTWTPTLTIDLGLLAAADGSPLGHLVQKSHGEVIAAMLGKTFQAEWIYTSWVYPGRPIDILSSRHLQNAKEV